MTTRGFPVELLEKGDRERRAYFRSYMVAHPRLVTAYEALSVALEDSTPGTLFFIIGPTGVGKTTLRMRIERQIIEDLELEINADPSRFPVIGLTATSPESGNFNWKDFFRRLLFALGEPCIDRKKVPEIRSGRLDTQTQYHVGRRAAGAELREAAEQILRLRRPVALLIDDAQHLAKMASGRRLADQLDCIKSIADVTGLPIGLFGTYELGPFRNLSAQLSRRSVDIHLWRYRTDQADDVRSFKNVIWSLQRHLPLAEEPDLVGDWEFLYERSIGCVGVLKDWIVKAFAKALRDKSDTLKRSHLESTPLSVSQCEKMLAEALEGEAALSESPGSRGRLRSKLGLSVQQAASALARSANDCARDDGLPLTSVKPKSRSGNTKRKRTPGRRHATRDPVGKNNGNGTPA